MIVSLESAVDLIKKGKIVAFPTETVYGLGADAYNIHAVKNTFQVKGRPSDNPLIVHISRIDQIHELAKDIPEEVTILAETFWPGPLTIILKKQKHVPDIVTGGLNTVAIRMPRHPAALELIRKTGPLTAPSANPSGKPSPTRAEHVEKDYNGTVPVLDGGMTDIGLESTVLDLTAASPEILRPGAVTSGMIEKVIKKRILEKKDLNSDKRKSPGTRYTHYKPEADVTVLYRLPSRFSSSSYYILHSADAGLQAPNVHIYSDNFSGLARDLYDHFRTADRLGYKKIQIQHLPAQHYHPLISALQNRINKALSKK